ncbi:MAG: hypothetical protein GWN62_23760 [Aliifodinibius sp.]|nr:hypothetical protein [Fodinibius sp.]
MGLKEEARFYLPILWLHPEENFMPEDCAIVTKVSDVRDKKGRILRNAGLVGKNNNYELSDLGDGELNDDSNFLDLRTIDMQRQLVLKHGDSSQIEGYGDHAIRKKAKEIGNTKLFEDLDEKKLQGRTPKCFIKIYQDLKFRTDELDRNPAFRYRHAEHYEGFTYDVIQFFFFYLFNDSYFNLHETDWDSTVEILLVRKDDDDQVLFRMVNYHMHGRNWLTVFPQKPHQVNMKEWLMHWMIREHERWAQDVNSPSSEYFNNPHFGTCFSINMHPFVFIARGAHGGYPTPGFSDFGSIGSFKTNQDNRTFSTMCILPPDYDKNMIVEVMKKAKDGPPPENTPNYLKDYVKSQSKLFDSMKAEDINVLTWDYEYIESGNGDKDWWDYKGLWGEKVNYKGWSGGRGPLFKKGMRLDEAEKKNNFKLRDYFNDSEGYRPATGPLDLNKLLKNFHGVL